MTKNWKQITAEKKIKFFFWSKTAIYLSLGLHNERPSYRRSLQLSKEDMQYFKTWTLKKSFYFCGSLLPSWIRIQIRIPNPDPDPQPWNFDRLLFQSTSQMNASSRIRPGSRGQKGTGSGSATLAGCSLLRVEGFSCIPDISKFYFFPSVLVIKTLDPDQDSLEMLDPDPFPHFCFLDLYWSLSVSYLIYFFLPSFRHRRFTGWSGCPRRCTRGGTRGVPG